MLHENSTCGGDPLLAPCCPVVPQQGRPRGRAITSCGALGKLTGAPGLRSCRVAASYARACNRTKSRNCRCISAMLPAAFVLARQLTTHDKSHTRNDGGCRS